jgi:hypothetical protein
MSIKKTLLYFLLVSAAVGVFLCFLAERDNLQAALADYRTLNRRLEDNPPANTVLQVDDYVESIDISRADDIVVFYGFFHDVMYVYRLTEGAFLDAVPESEDFPALTDFRNGVKTVRCPDGDVRLAIEKTAVGEYRFSVRVSGAAVSEKTIRLERWKKEDYTPSIAAAFAPGCRHVAVAYYGEVDFVTQGVPEIWLYSIDEDSFGRAAYGNTGFKLLADEDPYQDVVPRWSPDGKVFLYGDARYGINQFSVETGKRSWFVSGKAGLAEAKWSASGERVAAKRYRLEGSDSLYVVSYGTGAYYEFEIGGEILDFQWFHEAEKIGVLYRDRSCTEGESGRRSLSVIDFTA